MSRKKAFLWIFAVLALIFTSSLYAITGFTDAFSGPALDSEWTVMGTPGIFVSGHYRITHNGAGVSGLTRTVGSGHFTEVLELDNMSFDGVVDNQYKHIDTSGYQLIVQVINGTLNCGVWTGSAYLPKGGAVSLAGVTDLNLRFTWTDEPGLGGSWLIEYEADDGGYQIFRTIPADEFPSDDSAGRVTEFWMAASGTGTIDVDYYTIAGPLDASQHEPQVTKGDGSFQTDLSSKTCRCVIFYED